MLNSIQITSELKSHGFWLDPELDNTHAQGYRSSDGEFLVYIKTSRSKKEDPISPVAKQPMVLHWSIKSSKIYPNILDLVGEVNDAYNNHNMKLFSGPKATDKPHGIAINIKSEETLSQLLRLLEVSTVKVTSIYDDIFSVESELSKVTETTKRTLIEARLGQGKYRRDLIEFWSGCAITGVTNEKLLRASHIYPWSKSTNEERLDKFNGLLLTPNLDHVFDQGLISFDDEGLILIKDKILSPSVLLALNINKEMKLRKVSVQHQHYLKKHRQLYQFE